MAVQIRDSIRPIGILTIEVGITKDQAGKNRLSLCLKKTGMRSMVNVLQCKTSS